MVEFKYETSIVPDINFIKEYKKWLGTLRLSNVPPSQTKKINFISIPDAQLENFGMRELKDPSFKIQVYSSKIKCWIYGAGNTISEARLDAETHAKKFIVFLKNTTGIVFTSTVLDPPASRVQSQTGKITLKSESAFIKSSIRTLLKAQDGQATIQQIINFLCSHSKDHPGKFYPEILADVLIENFNFWYKEAIDKCHQGSYVHPTGFKIPKIVLHVDLDNDCHDIYVPLPARLDKDYLYGNFYPRINTDHIQYLSIEYGGFNKNKRVDLWNSFDQKIARIQMSINKTIKENLKLSKEFLSSSAKNDQLKEKEYAMDYIS